MTRIPTLCEEKGVRFVVVDSISAIFHGISIDNLVDAHERTSSMFAMMNCMRILADRYNVVFLVVNQMRANVSNTTNGSFSSTMPALGLSWSTCINQRHAIHI